MERVAARNLRDPYILYASPAGRVGEAVDGELSAAAVAPYRAATPRPADFNLGQVPRLGIGRVAPRS